MKDFIHEQYVAAQKAAAEAAEKGEVDVSTAHGRRALFYMNLEAQIPRLLEITGAVDDNLYLNESDTTLSVFEKDLTEEEKKVHEQYKNMHIGGVLRNLRERKGLKQGQVADRIGVSISLVSLMEKRKNPEADLSPTTFPESERIITPRYAQMILEGIGITSFHIEEAPELSYLMKRALWELQERNRNRVRRYS